LTLARGRSSSTLIARGVPSSSTTPRGMQHD
jgi:hypothetical protein